ncbi:alpha/beta hydrolase [bacterium]|nr:alpha/beta hydrolase [bacterium]
MTESTSIHIAQTLQRCPLQTPLLPEAIATTYVRQGKGNPPLLLLHGFDSSVLEFRRLLPLLAHHAETWAVDLLGFGFTDRPLGLGFSPQEIEAHLLCFLANLHSTPCSTGGCLNGRSGCHRLGDRHPEAVQALVLLDSAGLKPNPTLGKYLFPPLDRLATEFLRNPQVRSSISNAAYHDKRFNSADAQVCAALHLTMPHWHRALVAFTKSGGYGSFQSKLPAIACPTLILWGACDRILGTEDAASFHQGIPQSKLIWIPDCGHVPHLEKPQATCEAILEFLH